MNLQQISFSVPAIVMQNLTKRAGPLNIRPAEYARRLFDAAYAARIAGERGQETEDSDLDRAVRDVFLLADCEPDYIAQALGLPQERVTRILEGWRLAAKQLAEPAPAPAAPASQPPAVETKPAPPPGSGYPVDVIVPMWSEGKSLNEIAAAIGKTPAALGFWLKSHRDICPKRRGGA